MLDPEQQNPPTPNHPPPSSSHPPIYVPRKRQPRKKQQQLSLEANPKDLAAAYPEQGLPSTPSEPPETPAKATPRKKNVRKKKQQQQVELATPTSVDTTDADPLHQETGDATVPQPVPRKRVRKKAQSQSQQQPQQQQPQQQQPPAQPTPSPQLPSSILAPHELDASDMDLMQDLDDAGYTQQQHTLQRTTRRKRDRSSSDAPEETWGDFGRHGGYAGVFEEQEDEAPEEEEEASPKKKRKRIKEPGAPKKNLNGYMFFVSKRRRQIMDENPGLNLQGYGKVLGQTWRNMTEEEKKPYHELAAADKERYAVDKRVYEEEKAKLRAQSIPPTISPSNSLPPSASTHPSSVTTTPSPQLPRSVTPSPHPPTPSTHPSTPSLPSNTSTYPSSATTMPSPRPLTASHSVFTHPSSATTTPSLHPPMLSYPAFTHRGPLITHSPHPPTSSSHTPSLSLPASAHRSVTPSPHWPTSSLHPPISSHLAFTHRGTSMASSPQQPITLPHPPAPFDGSFVCRSPGSPSTPPLAALHPVAESPSATTLYTASSSLGEEEEGDDSEAAVDDSTRRELEEFLAGCNSAAGVLNPAIGGGGGMLWSGAEMAGLITPQVHAESNPFVANVDPNNVATLMRHRPHRGQHSRFATAPLAPPDRQPYYSATPQYQYATYTSHQQQQRHYLPQLPPHLTDWLQPSPPSPGFPFPSSIHVASLPPTPEQLRPREMHSTNGSDYGSVGQEQIGGTPRLEDQGQAGADVRSLCEFLGVDPSRAWARMFGRAAGVGEGEGRGAKIEGRGGEAEIEGRGGEAETECEGEAEIEGKDEGGGAETGGGDRDEIEAADDETSEKAVSVEGSEVDQDEEDIGEDVDGVEEEEEAVAPEEVEKVVVDKKFMETDEGVEGLAIGGLDGMFPPVE